MKMEEPQDRKRWPKREPPMEMGGFTVIVFQRALPGARESMVKSLLGASSSKAMTLPPSAMRMG
jgi:hypothetical protein